MKKNRKSYRFDDRVVEKINRLVEMECLEKSKLSIHSITSEREIVEAAIDYYFAMKTAEPVNDPLA